MEETLYPSLGVAVTVSLSPSFPSSTVTVPFSASYSVTTLAAIFSAEESITTALTNSLVPLKFLNVPATVISLPK